MSEKFSSKGGHLKLHEEKVPMVLLGDGKLLLYITKCLQVDLRAGNGRTYSSQKKVIQRTGYFDFCIKVFLNWFLGLTCSIKEDQSLRLILAFNIRR